MIKYISKNSKKSGVISYENGEDFIIVQFKKYMYKYSNKSCSLNHINNMKKLAEESKGLNTYISKIRPSYEWKR